MKNTSSVIYLLYQLLGLYSLQFHEKNVVVAYFNVLYSSLL